MMDIKKLIISFAACLALVFSLNLAVYAKSAGNDITAAVYTAENSSNNKNRVIDNADLLSSDQEESLRRTIRSIAEKHFFDAVIVTVPDTDGKTPRDYADDYYDYNGYGIGSGHDGVLLLISMAERDWYISTCGYGIKAFTDYGIKKAGELITPSLSDGSYYRAFEKFLEITEDFVKEAKNNKPYDHNHEYKTAEEGRKDPLITGIGSGTAFLISLLIVSG